jgi:hypothetical protein
VPAFPDVATPELKNNDPDTPADVAEDVDSTMDPDPPLELDPLLINTDPPALVVTDCPPLIVT